MFTAQATTMQKIELPEIAKQEVELWVWRLDQIDAIASGNKYFKLQAYFEYLKNSNDARVLSFGGAFSNHIHALAYYAHQHRVPCELFIRGERSACLNSTLSDVQKWDATLHFVDRLTYRRKHEASFLSALHKKYPDTLIIPEGGGGVIGSQGAQQMAVRLVEQLHEQNLHFDTVAMACGTGSSFEGFAQAFPYAWQAEGSLQANGATQLIAMPVLKGVNELYDRLSALNNKGKRVTVDRHAHYGGYAKCPEYLWEFAQRLYAVCGVPLDPIYTVKVLYRLYEKIQQGEFAKGTKILMVHTGGLQGCRGMRRAGKNWPYQYRIAQ